MTSVQHRLRIVPPRALRWGAALSCAALALLAGAGARADDWPTPGLDATHARLSAERSGAQFSDGRWSYTPPTSARALASPVVADGFAVSVDLDGTVSALEAESSRLVWQLPLGSPVQIGRASCRERVLRLV